MPLLAPIKPPGSRSNRMLTQKVLLDLGIFFSSENCNMLIKKIYGPIRVNYTSSLFEAHIKGNLVFAIDKTRKQMLVTNGGYFDKQGNPTASTKELLNGVFDCLEAYGFMSHCRVYTEDDQCLIKVQNASKCETALLDNKHEAVKLKLNY